MTLPPVPPSPNPCLPFFPYWLQRRAFDYCELMMSESLSAQHLRHLISCSCVSDVDSMQGCHLQMHLCDVATNQRTRESDMQS